MGIVGPGGMYGGGGNFFGGPASGSFGNYSDAFNFFGGQPGVSLSDAASMAQTATMGMPGLVGALFGHGVEQSLADTLHAMAPSLAVTSLLTAPLSVTGIPGLSSVIGMLLGQTGLPHSIAESLGLMAGSPASGAAPPAGTAPGGRPVTPPPVRTAGFGPIDRTLFWDPGSSMPLGPGSFGSRAARNYYLRTGRVAPAGPVTGSIVDLAPAGPIGGPEESFLLNITRAMGRSRRS
jgi:hypothetical protein